MRRAISLGRRQETADGDPVKLRDRHTFTQTLAASGSAQDEDQLTEREKTAGEWEGQQRAWHREAETGRLRQVGRCGGDLDNRRTRRDQRR